MPGTAQDLAQILGRHPVGRGAPAGEALNRSSSFRYNEQVVPPAPAAGHVCVGDVMTPRVARLRRETLETPPWLSVERARLLTDFYRSAPAASVPVTRALAFEHLLANKVIYIGDDELIVGERGPAPKATPTYPELCCHTLEDLDVLHSRPKISFRVDDEAPKGVCRRGDPVLARAVDARRALRGDVRRVEGRLLGWRLHRVHGTACARAHGPRRCDLPPRPARPDR